MSTMANTPSEDEWRKRLTALALLAPSMVVIDNVEGEFGGAALAMALTSGEVQDRVLGDSTIVYASLRPVWAITGNNIEFRGDLGRRVVPIDLDPSVEHPEDRVFERPDLLGFTLANRGRLVTAALTALRAYILAGRPPHGKPAKGSFEHWDRLIRGALIWAGLPDPLGGTARLRSEGDADRDKLRALLHAWHQAFGAGEKRVGTVIEYANMMRNDDEDGGCDLYSALAEYCPGVELRAQKLGTVLRKHKGRIVDGMRLVRCEGTTGGSARWRVEVVGGQATLPVELGDSGSES